MSGYAAVAADIALSDPVYRATGTIEIRKQSAEVVPVDALFQFERISDRGGVLGAMETMYQRGKIQEESLFYEHKKHTGALPGRVLRNTYWHANHA